MEVDTDSRAATVVRSVVQLAHGLGIEVVAEGVETARQADVLTEMEVDQLQGFWLARPAPIEDALSLIGADPGRD
jgi:EAL domain-containing protein (putative c-di-GMP-specific phosphodiesterase class I)